jgi:hypothetical protein
MPNCPFFSFPYIETNRQLRFGTNIDGGIQTGFFAGFSVLALIAVMDMINGGLYASIMQQYGSKEEA